MEHFFFLLPEREWFTWFTTVTGECQWCQWILKDFQGFSSGIWSTPLRLYYYRVIMEFMMESRKSGIKSWMVKRCLSCSFSSVRRMWWVCSFCTCIMKIAKMAFILMSNRAALKQDIFKQKPINFHFPCFLANLNFNHHFHSGALSNKLFNLLSFYLLHILSTVVC